MKSFTLTTLFFILAALFTTPIVGDYVERRGYDQGFGSLEVRAPVPGRRRGGGSDDGGNQASAGTAAAAIASLVGVGAIAMAVGAAAMY